MAVDMGINGNYKVRQTSELVALLLKDQTLSTSTHQVNIFWATDDYLSLGSKGYDFFSQIVPEQVMDDNALVIRPRVMKHETWQNARSKDMAEVFTPAWVCNRQNQELTDEDGRHTWKASSSPVAFPVGKKWQDYVKAKRLEMACGESPYLVSRYDATTGATIPLCERIGLLDRKFRIINENTASEPTTLNKRFWRRKAYQALQSVYGFDWQGDNVYLSRESLLCTFIDYYVARWGKMPQKDSLMKAAEIISWNIWQMDGTKFVVPKSCHDERNITQIKGKSFKEQMVPCEGCCKNDNNVHNGTYCKIMEWTCAEPLKGKCILFKELIDK